MKIYYKLLIATLPLVLIALISGAGITYYISKKTITHITADWLETQLAVALRTVEANEEFLRRYGIMNIESGEKKAKYDALQDLRSVVIRNYGFLMVLDQNGLILHHPRAEMIGRSVGGEDWFVQMKQRHWGSLDLSWLGERYLSVFEYYWPWGWYLAVMDPHHEVYGAVGRTRNYILFLAVAGSAFLALILIILVRKLTVPLRQLVETAEKIGQGQLDARIPAATRDEFGQLAGVFNVTASKLEKSLGDIERSERYFRSLIENTSDLILLLNKDGLVKYASPSLKRALGYQSPEIIGSPAVDLAPGEARSDFRTFFSHASKLESRMTIATEAEFLHKNGSRRLFELTGQNLLDDPSIEGLVLNARDITIRKQFESELVESEKRLRYLTSRLLRGQENERKRLAIELHDEIGQLLTVMKLKIIMIERELSPRQDKTRLVCEETLAYIDQVIEDVRRLCNDLTPSALQDLGLTSALAWLVEEFARHNNWEASLDLIDLDDYFDQEKQIIIYRIFQETLTNIGKHARAGSVRVLAEEKKDGIYFLIEDDGRGFEPKQVKEKGPLQKGLGLTAIEERARMLGASFDIQSQPGQGAGLRLLVPWSDRIQ